MCYTNFMTWALKRQLFYVFVLILFFAVAGTLIAYPKLNKAPSCVDQKQNGNESGIDCGGSCPNACIFQVDEVSVLWSRAFRVVPGRYNAVAYLENHNNNTAVNKIRYKFRFADKDNIYIGKREGETFVPPGAKFAVFEAAIDVGNSIPVYTTFEFTEMPRWIQVPKEKIDQLKLSVQNVTLTNETTSPALSATVKNNSLFLIPNVSVVTVLYDKSGNAIGASRSFIERLRGEESAEVNFTWPEPILGGVVAKEILPMFNIFSVKLQ